MGPVWTITAKDLRLRVRDKSAFLYGIVAPFVLAAVLGLVFDGTDDLGELVLGIAIEDDGDVGQGLREGLVPALSDDAAFEVETLPDRDAAVAAVDEGTVEAALVVPAGLSEALRGAGPVSLEVVSHPDRPLAATVADAVADGVAADLTTRRTLGAAATLAGVPDEELAAAMDAPASPLTVTERAAEDGGLDAGTYLAAGMAVFFLFFTVQFGITSLLDERREGTLARLRASPVPARAVILSKALTSFLLGVVSMATLVVASGLLLGADWGSTPAVAVLVVAAVVSSVGIVTLLAAFARTAEQASTWQSIVAVVFGMLGGAFFPVADDGVLRLLSRLTPHAWFLDALGDVAGGEALASIVPALAVLVAFGAVTGGIGLVKLRRGLA